MLEVSGATGTQSGISPLSTFSKRSLDVMEYNPPYSDSLMFWLPTVCDDGGAANNLRTCEQARPTGPGIA
jgi:hypothetical protein